MEDSANLMLIIYFVALFVFMYWCCQRVNHDTRHASSNLLNEVRLDNGRHSTNINSDQQPFLMPEQPHQPHNAAQTSRTNIFTPFPLNDRPPSYDECMASSRPPTFR